MDIFNKNKMLTKGTSPKLLILSGMHGDEYEVIDSVKKAVRKYWKELPDFVCVPEVSPSAILQKTRKNGEKVDLNRSFFKNTKIGEALSLMNLVSQYTFDVCWDFHEDPELSEFYLYDSGSMSTSERWNSFIQNLRQIGISLYSGIDDPTDANLGFQITDGYISIPHGIGNKTGMFSEWALEEGIIKRYLNPEIPGKVIKDKKNLTVDFLFKDLILK